MESPKLPAESSTDVVQLWKRSTVRPGHYMNIATNFSTAHAPSLASGGILADDMGLGKTLQVIGTILEGGTGSTLIVAPLSVMSNWSQQIERHVKSEHALKVMTYHGSGRKSMSPKQFSEYDVVITTYGKVFLPLLKYIYTKYDKGCWLRNTSKAGTKTILNNCPVRVDFTL